VGIVQVDMVALNLSWIEVAALQHREFAIRFQLVYLKNLAQQARKEVG
jgi:hypothetical protein